MACGGTSPQKTGGSQLRQNNSLQVIKLLHNIATRYYASSLLPAIRAVNEIRELCLLRKGWAICPVKGPQGNSKTPDGSACQFASNAEKICPVNSGRELWGGQLICIVPKVEFRKAKNSAQQASQKNSFVTMQSKEPPCEKARRS